MNRGQGTRGKRLRGAHALLERLTWGDRLLMLAVLAGSIGLFPWLRGGATGQAAVVRVDNEVVATLALHEERELVVQGPLGETVIQVQAGKVRVVRDPGPRQLCVLQGWISRAGEALVCLPNRVMVQIPGPLPFDSVTR